MAPPVPTGDDDGAERPVPPLAADTATYTEESVAVLPRLSVAVRANDRFVPSWAALASFKSSASVSSSARRTTVPTMAR